MRITRKEDNGCKREQTKKRIYECVADFLLSNGYSPSVREICELTGLQSTSTIKGYLDDLVVDGLITMRSDSPRTIVVKGIRYVDERKKEYRAWDSSNE